MNHQQDSTTIDQALDAIFTYGLDGIQHAVTVLLNHAFRIERAQYVGAGHYERSAERSDWANGYKPKTLRTQFGEHNLQIPQTRNGGFYPSAIERGQRSARALYIAMAEMYVQGVSTRKVTKILKELCGCEVTSMQVSRASQELDESLELWRQRKLGCYRYVLLDARYENVRFGGTVVGAAVLWAVGIDENGKKEPIGVSVALSEAETHWRDFMESLVSRGLHGVQMITSDAHTGLAAARKAVFPSVPWQRCQFHLQQNAGHYVPKIDMREEVAAVIRAVYDAPNREEADRLLKMAVEDLRKPAPKLAQWMEENVPQGLTVFELPRAHRKKLRTTNLLERENQEIKRRTKVATVFPNEASCLRLITALLMELDEEWKVGRRYINMDVMQ